MKFELTPEQEKQYDEWRKSLPKVDYGTSGGGYWFSFCPTGIGTIIKVVRDDGEELDLTDVDNW